MESVGGEAQWVQQLECQLANCGGAAVAELQAVREQLAFLDPRC